MAKNLLTDNQATAENDIYDYTITGTTETISLDTEHVWQGAKSIKSVNTGGSYYEGPRLQVPMVALPNTQYSFSIWVWALVGKIVYIRGTESTSAGTWIGYLSPSSTHVVGIADWQRISFTATTSASTGKVDIMAHGENSTAQTFWTDGWQIEQSDVATIWRLPSAWGRRNAGRKVLLLL